jgi:cell division protein FtsI (penicillin-binding protein 3)
MKTMSHRDDKPCRPRHFKPSPCAPAPIEGPGQQSIETSHTRLIITGALFLLAFLVIGARLVEVAAFNIGDPRIAHAHSAEKPDAGRADIVDRNGVLLARTLAAVSLYANPKEIQKQDPRRVAQLLAALLPDLVESELYAKLTSDRSFVWIKRQLTPRQEAEVNRLGIPGLYFRAEDRRIYPQGKLAAHVTGYVDIDNKGLAGLERGFDEVLRDRHEPVTLSLDVRLQYILREEIARQIGEFNAVGGMGVVMDVATGEVLAMVSLPDFDPNDPATATQSDSGSDAQAPGFNRATLGVYEMGSTFKIFNTAMALDSHVANLGSSFDATKPLQIGRFTIHDDHAQRRWLTVPEIFTYSSNIGSARMAVEAGIERQQDYLGRLGLLSTPVFELPELGAPHVPAVWHTVNSMTIAFGHGIAVSPLQMATAVSAVVNGGVLHHPTLIKQPPGYTPAGEQVLSAQTSEEMRRLLRLVVEHGTGKLAAAPGYLVGGKTGTAEKVEGQRYDRKQLLSSFVGAFPINAPRFVVMISIDEPHGTKRSFGFATGGWVAAPAVSRVIQRMAPIMGVAPVDEDSPEIRRSLMVDSFGPQGRKIAAN